MELGLAGISRGKHMVTMSLPYYTLAKQYIFWNNGCMLYRQLIRLDGLLQPRDK